MTTDWKKLRHSDGIAEDIPALLDQLSPDPMAMVWDELWSLVCHQDSNYSASFAVVPHLLSAAERWEGSARLQPLLLAASIVFYAKRSREYQYKLREQVDAHTLQRLESTRRKVYGLRGDEHVGADTVRQLEELAYEALGAPGLSERHFTYPLQAALLLREDRIWGPTLDHLVDGEFPGICPLCRKDLYIVVRDDGCFVTDEEWMNRPKTRRYPIEPAMPDSLQGTPRWLRHIAVQRGQDNLVQRLEYVFGRSFCPNCGSPIELPDAIAAAVWPPIATL